MTIPVIGGGCGGAGEVEQFRALQLSPEGLASTLVPNTDLDLYVYVKQDNPTTLPKDMIDLPLDVSVESFAIWGISANDDFAFGGGIALTSTDDAANAYTQITPQKDTWTAVSGNTIFFVQGSGTAAEALKTAISNNDFKYYDDRESLQEVAAFPDGETIKRVATGIVKPSKTLVNRIVKIAAPESSDLVNMILTMVRLEVIAGGLYASHQIDVAEMAKAVNTGGSIWESDAGVLVLIKSGLPGFVVSPVVKMALRRSDYTEVYLGGLTLFQGSLTIEDGKSVPILVRVEGNRVFFAVAGKESYAQTLITSVKR